jgi:hypothetical protein
MKNPCLRVMHERRWAQGTAARLKGLAGSRAALGLRCGERQLMPGAVALSKSTVLVFQFNDLQLQRSYYRARRRVNMRVLESASRRENQKIIAHE